MSKKIKEQKKVKKNKVNDSILKKTSGGKKIPTYTYNSYLDDGK